MSSHPLDCHNITTVKWKLSTNKSATNVSNANNTTLTHAHSKGHLHLNTYSWRTQQFGGDCHLTIFRVLGLSNAAIWSGSLIVVLRQGQGPDAWTRRWLAAWSFWFLQAAVIVAVLRGILQVLHGVGGGEGHSPMGVLKNRENKWPSLTQGKYFSV